MIKIGITGSLASGKTTASKIISKKNGPLFSADKVVKKLYVQEKFKKLVSKKLNFKLSSDFKSQVKEKIFKKKINLKKLEKIIHPAVRKEMKLFIKKIKIKNIYFVKFPFWLRVNFINILIKRFL